MTKDALIKRVIGVLTMNQVCFILTKYLEREDIEVLKRKWKDCK